MFPGPSTNGFDRAPFSKGLLAITGAASLINLLLASSVKNVFPGHKWITHIGNVKVYFAVSSPFYYSTARDLICGSFLLYCFRLFERRYGSSKYASFAFATSFLAAGLQLTAVFTLRHYGIPVAQLPTGPYGMLFACLLQYYCDVAAVDGMTFLGMPLTGKFLTYTMALQMLVATRESLVAGVCGLLAGILYRYNVFYVGHWLRIPTAIVNIASKTLGRIFKSTVPATQPFPMGATLEVQQQQQMEWYEQQMFRRRAGSLRQRGRARMGQGYADVLVPPGGGGWLPWADNSLPPPYDQLIQNNHNDPVPAPQQPTAEVSEEQVQTLVEMGFSRQAVLQALTATNNDITMATNFLLADS